MAYYFYEFPIGTLCIEESEGVISRIGVGTAGSGGCEETAVIRQAHMELEEYFRGERTDFAVKVRPQGTDFQRKVWEALRRIPYGETRTYGEIAAQIGNPKASRAVGGACNKNPILIMTPCHRVIGAGGKLVGFGAGLPMKEKLLAHEKLHLDAVEKQCYNK